jgi:hypothetical protein
LVSQRKESRASGCCMTNGLTNRSSQPPAVATRTFDFMKQFPMLGKLAAASGG